MFCRDKHVFVATKDVFCRDKSMFDATKICRDKNIKVIFVATSFKHVFVATKHVFCRNYFCRDKTRVFVATKMILVAAPSNDTLPLPQGKKQV